VTKIRRTRSGYRAAMPVPLHIVAGHLGAGKTTVVRHLLRTLPGRTAVVVNDFGDAGVDEALLGGAGALREISGSCVCCTAPEGFVAAVAQLAESGVDRIVVEPTGLARPADLVDTLRRSAAPVELRPLVVLVDPRAGALGSFPQSAAEQAGVADALVATHVDVCTDGEIQGFRSWAAGLWPGPHVVLEIAGGALPDSALEWPEGRGPRAEGAHDHDHPPHGFVARSWRWPPDRVFHRGRLLDAIAGMPADRAKGLFRTDEGVILLQKAGGRMDEEPSGWRTDSRADVITRDPDVLEAASVRFERAFATPEERAARGQLLEVAGPGPSRTYDRAALAALPGLPDVSTVAPGRAGRAAWLSAVLGDVPAGAQLVVVAADGYVTDPVPVSALGEAVLLHSIGDAPLPAAQGGPFRLLVPGGATAAGPCANVKGVVRLAVRSGS
jgi:G3E family GTPase